MMGRLKNLAAFSTAGGVAWLGLSAVQHVGGSWAAAVVASIFGAYVIFGPEV